MALVSMRSTVIEIICGVKPCCVLQFAGAWHTPRAAKFAPTIVQSKRPGGMIPWRVRRQSKPWPSMFVDQQRAAGSAAFSTTHQPFQQGRCYDHELRQNQGRNPV